MSNIIGIINTVNEQDRLEELTYHRCIASVPFGGRYRLVDFILSSMVNSGITNVAVLAHTKYRSLMDHLGSGKEWDLDRKRSGLFILPPVNEGMEAIKGDLHALYGHRDFLYRSSEEFVLITRSHMVCNIDFSDLQHHHVTMGADITVMYKETEEPGAMTRRLITNAKGKVTSVRERNGWQQGNKVSMEIFFLRKSLLLQLMENALAEGHDNLVRDAFLKNMDHLNIYGYRYQGYLGVVNTLQSYYKHSMNMLNPSIWRELFFQPGLVYTKIKDEPPTRYQSSSKTRNCLVANGCVIEGNVENSILFRGVKVQKGATVKNSIILQNGIIHENADIEHVILDKEVIIGAGRILKGHDLAPFIAVKKKVI